MKRVILMAFGLCLALQMNAQETPKKQEVGIVFSDLNNFGLTYRVGNAQALWRFNTLLINGRVNNSYGDSTDIINTRFGTSLSVGREYRKPITEKLTFRYGLDLFTALNTQHQKVDDKTVNDQDQNNRSTAFRPGINAVIGVNYALGDGLLLGVEILPFVSYDININESINSFQTSAGALNYGLTNTSTQLSLVYQF